MDKERITIVKIKKYSNKGCGVGSSEEFSKDIEIKEAFVGESVRAQILKSKQGVHQGKLLELLSTHACRVAARCEHVPLCGGCSYQSLDYAQQLLDKEETIKKLFSAYPHAEFSPIVGMQDPWLFRNKMEFTFYESREGEKALGLIMSGTKGRVLNINKCLVAREWMSTVLHSIRSWWAQTSIKAYHRLKQEGTLHTLTLREGIHTGDKMVILTVCGDPAMEFRGRELQGFKEAIFAAIGENVSLFLQIKHIAKGTPTTFHEMHLHGRDHICEKLTLTLPSGDTKTLTFKISPSSFFQPNTKQAEKLFSEVLRLITFKQELNVLDLYCGTATLGIVVSSLARQIYGIELNPYAVFDAEVNLELNQISNMKLLQGDVKDKIAELPSLGSLDLVILDPPRSGLGPKNVAQVLALAPEEILYVSCNPRTQVEDVKEFTLGGYEVKKIQAVGQFPHTPHVENIVLLQKSR